MSPVTLYKKQKQIIDFIKQYIQKNGSSPTLTEIAKAMNVNSLATIHEHLTTLEKKGVIKRFQGTVRGIQIVEEKIADFLQGIELPLVGYIAAGKPIEALEDTTQTMTVSPNLLTGKKRAFVLQVKGESMIEDGILDGDYVVIEQQDIAQNGDIVVALLENEFATLKRFYRESNRIRLEPANAKMKPIYATDVKVQGKVVGVIRKFH